MLTTAIFDQYVREYEQWYEDHPEVYRSEIEAVREHLVNLPDLNCPLQPLASPHSSEFAALAFSQSYGFLSLRLRQE